MSRASSTSSPSITAKKTETAAPAVDKTVSSLTNYSSTAAALAESAADTSSQQISEMLSALESGAKLPGVSTHNNGLNFIQGLIDRVDAEVNSQLNEVMHNEEFLKLEGTWRGLQKLLTDTDTNKTLWVEMLNATKTELVQDFKDADDYSQSALWKLVYEGRYDVSGGKPFGAFVSGFEFENKPQDIDLLTGFAGIGGAAQVPVIVSASPKLLGIKSFEDLKNLNEIKNTLTHPEYTKWNMLRKSPDARFLAITLPRVLARLPYGKDTLPDNDLPTFQEAPRSNRGKLERMPNEQMCWSSSAYSLGSVLTKAFRQTNWCTAIVGVQRGRLNGGTVSDMPLYQYYNEGGNLETTIPTETVITGDREHALSELGFMPLSYELDTDRACFVGGRTMFEPTGQKGSQKYNNDFVSSILANVMPAARISHHMKKLCRKWHGSFKDGPELKRILNDWLAEIKGDANCDEKTKVEKPLQDFEIQIDKTGPGIYDVKLSLKFWDMLYQVNADVEMVSKLSDKDK